MIEILCRYFVTADSIAELSPEQQACLHRKLEIDAYGMVAKCLLANTNLLGPFEMVEKIGEAGIINEAAANHVLNEFHHFRDQEGVSFMHDEYCWMDEVFTPLAKTA